MNTCELLEISSSIVPDRTAVIFDNDISTPIHKDNIKLMNILRFFTNWQ